MSTLDPAVDADARQKDIAELEKLRGTILARLVDLQGQVQAENQRLATVKRVLSQKISGLQRGDMVRVKYRGKDCDGVYLLHRTSIFVMVCVVGKNGALGRAQEFVGVCVQPTGEKWQGRLP